MTATGFFQPEIPSQSSTVGLGFNWPEMQFFTFLIFLSLVDELEGMCIVGIIVIVGWVNRSTHGWCSYMLLAMIMMWCYFLVVGFCVRTQFLKNRGPFLVFFVDENGDPPLRMTVTPELTSRCYKKIFFPFFSFSFFIAFSPAPYISPCNALLEKVQCANSERIALSAMRYQRIAP